MFVCKLVSVFLVFSLSDAAFDVTTSTPDVKVKENEGVDLTCSNTADFGADARVEWKFKNKGSTAYVIFGGKPTTPYAGRVTKFDGRIRFSKVTRQDTGEYSCEVSGNSKYGEAKIQLTVLVPPSVPTCLVPSSPTTGGTVVLACSDPDASPPATYKWYKNGTPLPVDPKKFPEFKNFTYSLNPTTGNLEFPSVALVDSADYYCESSNMAGPSQRCQARKMEVREMNTGGIVAGVIVALLAVALLVFGLWYASRKGYLPKKSESKPKPSVVYQPTSEYGDEEDGGGGEFRQKSSFVV
ncbi:F11 receptor, tandem duplicate 1 [Osmerus mordax]|uniref:F11 receptor, tandem duplicate 1 n=1 Tax=Osmerus mordax TaxID=8014 RepID=UPI0035109DA9